MVAEVSKVIFGLVWRPAQRSKVANFISKFYYKGYKFLKVMNIDLFFYINIYTLNKKIYNLQGIHIYVVIYLGTKKYTYKI